MYANIRPLLTNELTNYILPGLSSFEITKARVFTMQRPATTMMAPHTRRYELRALVIEGVVTNTVYVADPYGCSYAITSLNYKGHPGSYVCKDTEQRCAFTQQINAYGPGDWYSLRADEFCSMSFEHGAEVLILEGPQISDSSRILEPVDAEGKRIETFRVEPWMFK